ncbi:aminotransferase class I/II-fold pyridoxal phosphate-dependent enzyme [Tropicimonas isoalkanivorans]|uniref:Aminotransferase n=1 Tax=Tropicimonas isoalkanivorans TaxID=441112 RepID=A0A1I1GCU4_9RHOB|nr:aminotransferase class I/II-fold pyridoxal phosphate-dependent enzyme [Tropicimonas isoalkanivorans]SFC09391.1 aspartate aminotransferase [Tropicimonas isoalkanivorans]
MSFLSQRSRSASDEIRPVFEFFAGYRADVPDENVRADLTFGNPHEMPLPGLVACLKDRAEPHSVDWFAYKTSEEEPRTAVADTLRAELGLPFTPEDIAMTAGAFGAIAAAFSMLLDPGDECITPLPGWFCYSTMLAARGARTVPVPLSEGTFELDVAAIEAAITARTRIVVVNTPHNPTGVIYSRERLSELADMLTAKSEEIGHPIFVLSDEPYRRIRFDGHSFTSPAAIYARTLIDYSYGKILLAPGLRIGYLAISPLMPEDERTALQSIMTTTQVSEGWAFPDAPLQYAIGDLEKLSIDIGALEARRDRMHGALTQWGYDLTKPAGTFYLWGRAPGGDSAAFAEALARDGVFIMPGTLFDRPSDFRICLTATSEMIEASLPAFKAAAGI